MHEITVWYAPNFRFEAIQIAQLLQELAKKLSGDEVTRKIYQLEAGDHALPIQATIEIADTGGAIELMDHLLSKGPVVMKQYLKNRYQVSLRVVLIKGRKVIL